MDTQVIQFLLAKNYYLTALELLVESQQAGRLEEVEDLQVCGHGRVGCPVRVEGYVERGTGARDEGGEAVPAAKIWPFRVVGLGLLQNG